MAIIKTRRSENFTVIPNRILENKRLRLQDKGLLAYLLSKPQTWQIRADVLASELGAGRDAIYGMLKNIRMEGYATFTKHSDGKTDWVVYDMPRTKNPDQENPDQENPDQENPDQENPDQAFPHDIVKKELLVKKEVLVNKENTVKTEPPPPPQGGYSEPVNSVSNETSLTDSVAPTPNKEKKIAVVTQKKQSSETLTGETWNAYAGAYEQRYGVMPVRNATVSGQLAQFVKRIGREEAPFVAIFFVMHNSAFYVKKMHAAGVMLADAEKLRTEWATNKRMTDTQARQADQTQARGNLYDQLVEEFRREGRM